MACICIFFILHSMFYISATRCTDPKKAVAAGHCAHPTVPYAAYR